MCSIAKQASSSADHGVSTALSASGLLSKIACSADHGGETSQQTLARDISRPSFLTGLLRTPAVGPAAPSACETQRNSRPNLFTVFGTPCLC